MIRFNCFFISCFILMPCLAFAAEAPRYNRDVRPILSDKCFACHGPDAAKRKAGLRLDVRENALENNVIVPGQPQKSELLKRILSHDENEVMPPPEAKLEALKPQEIETIRQWIKGGAVYEAHWSFIPLKPVKVPAVKGTISPIDAFVRETLKQRGLKPQPEATKETLIRRLSFDLTGLPPTPDEVRAFVQDKAPNAYEKVVDRLLASPRYGERMAVDWLDLSRYADSYGFQVDRERDVWMWRDWVIKAFNENLPYDKFVTWQLAGDLLPNATDEQILATAFNRLHQQEAEGGSVEEEYRVEYVADRVQTFSTAFLGLTSDCARCHDHKFDPISHKDYYSLFAYFQNIDEAGLYSFFTPSPPTPALMLLDDNSKKRRDELKQRIDELEKQSQLSEVQNAAFETWLKNRPAMLEVPGEIGRFSFDALDKNKLANEIKADQPATLHGENKIVPGQNGNAVEFTGDDAVDLPFGNFQRHEPFSISLWLKTPDLKERAVVFHRSRAWTDAASRGYELLIEEGKLKWSLIHFWPGNAISIKAKEPLPLKQWTHVVVSSDGSSRAGGLRFYVDGKPAETEIIKDNLTKNITGGGGDNIALGERFRDKGFKGGAIDEFRVWNRELSPLEAKLVAETQIAGAPGHPLAGRIAPTPADLKAYYFAAFDEESKKQRAALLAARAEETKLADEAREIMVMRELPQPKKSYVLWRGEYNQRRDEVSMTTPKVLPPMPKDAPNNRLGLAQWLTAKNHPLFARVTVNRFWQGLFGRGIVKTSEDFGAQGDKPSHPELLDYLALEFQKNWDTKALLKAIVMSQTYRQRSVTDKTTMTDDPDNQWLARGPRFRLPAEMIRDNSLLASGLLAEKVGGAPVNPYEMTQAFKPVGAGTGANLYRRSLYTTWRRTSPPPALLTFDAPRRAVCIARRERTDSPLQALILLNGTQYVEAARVLGEKLHQDSNGNTTKMIEAGFLRCLSRLPDAREADICRQLLEEQKTFFAAQPDEALKLLKTGNAPRDEKIPTPEAAAATVLAQALLNHDESIVKR